MPRLDPLTLKRPGDIEESKTFTDPLQPGQELSLTLKVSASAAQGALLTERCRALITQYVTGDTEYQQTKDEEKPSGKPPVPVLDNETARAIPISTGLCIDIGLLMQSEEGGAKGKEGAETPYTFMDWVFFSERMPTAFEAAVNWAKELDMRVRGAAAGNVAGESGSTGKTSSDSPSDTA